MSSYLELFLCLIVWVVVIIKSRPVIKRGVWHAGGVAFIVWLTTLFFAITMTFLFDNIAIAFDAVTFNNLSRLFAYASAALALYFTASSALLNQPSSFHKFLSSLIGPYVILTLVGLLVTYVVFISVAPEWVNHHIPSNHGEGLFMFLLYSFALIMCLLLVTLNSQHLRREKVTLMRVRVTMIIVTEVCGGAYFLVKTLMVFSLFWPGLGSPAMIRLSVGLLVLSALLWGTAFLSNRVYTWVVNRYNSLSQWLIFSDLQRLARILDEFCPSIEIPDRAPGFWQFFKNSDFYLYRAIIHILDGKATLEDILAHNGGQSIIKNWDAQTFTRAQRVNAVLKPIQAEDDFWLIVQTYHNVSKRLISKPRFGSILETES